MLFPTAMKRLPAFSACAGPGAASAKAGLSSQHQWEPLEILFLVAVTPAAQRGPFLPSLLVPSFLAGVDKS